MKTMFFLLSLFVLCLLASTLVLGTPQLPELKWEPRSDWINVKTDVTPHAVGDGVADDTAAIQAAMDKLSDISGQPTTVYLPAGTYRISNTLEIKQKDGISLVGTGRTTTVVWDGPTGTGDDSRMCWSNGAPRSRYIGIIWDGNNKAGVGFDHDSKGYFETEIDHKYEAYLNFTGSGLRVGHNQQLASAETSVENCLFVNCDRGVAMLQFNDYNFSIYGCEFQQCGTGVYCGKGANFYVRDSHFVGSKVTDISLAPEHACSVRRTTSVGSRMFLVQGSLAPLTIQDCQVSGWTNPAGAISLNYGPTLIFDCVFTKPPSRQQPIVVANNQHIILSNVRSFDTDGLVKPGASNNVTIVPPGKIGSSLKSPQQTFFKEQAVIPGKIFDAKRDFGAKADGKTDDTAAIQATIDAANKAGKGAMAYLPSGDYAVTKTLEVSGRDFYFGGSGIHTRLMWQGAKDGVLVHVHDPLNVAMENMTVGEAGQQQNAEDIRQTGSGVPTHMLYERVWAYGMYAKQPFKKGVHFLNLPKGSVVQGNHVTGNLHVENCSRAEFLFNTSYEGSIVVEGKEETKRDGLLGFQTRLSTIILYGVYVRDSQNLTMSDYYIEQADQMLNFQGNPEDPAGHVTISMVKCHCNVNPNVLSDNYKGRIALGPTMFYPGGINPAMIVSKGANPLQLVFMSCMAYGQTPKFELAPATTCTMLENTGDGMGANVIPDGGLQQVTAALDDLRKLGAADLALNYPAVKK